MANPGNRWRVLLHSGCQEGVELQGVWEGIQREAREGADWLREPLDPLLSSSMEGLGDGCMSGATRGQVVEARDMLRSRLLSQA